MRRKKSERNTRSFNISVRALSEAIRLYSRPGAKSSLEHPLCHMSLHESTAISRGRELAAALKVTAVSSEHPVGLAQKPGGNTPILIRKGPSPHSFAPVSYKLIMFSCWGSKLYLLYNTSYCRSQYPQKNSEILTCSN